MKQVIVARRVGLQAPERVAPKLEKLLKQAEEEIGRRQTLGPFKTAEEMRQSLKSQID